MPTPVNSVEIVPVKDGIERPIPGAWRPVLVAVVDAFVRGDYGLRAAVPGVEPVSAETADQMREYVRDYGAHLTALPEETWQRSVCTWMDGYWNVLVDLWTEEEGGSDLVLELRVSEHAGGYRFNIHLVYVP